MGFKEFYAIHRVRSVTSATLKEWYSEACAHPTRSRLYLDVKLGSIISYLKQDTSLMFESSCSKWQAIRTQEYAPC